MNLLKMKLNLIIRLLKNHMLYFRDFFIFNVLIFDGNSSDLICPVLVTSLFCPWFFCLQITNKKLQKLSLFV